MIGMTVILLSFISTSLLALSLLKRTSCRGVVHPYKHEPFLICPPPNFAQPISHTMQNLTPRPLNQSFSTCPAMFSVPPYCLCFLKHPVGEDLGFFVRPGSSPRV